MAGSTEPNVAVRHGVLLLAAARRIADGRAVPWHLLVRRPLPGQPILRALRIIEGIAVHFRAAPAAGLAHRIPERQ